VIGTDLLAIIRQNKAEQEYWASTPPTSCPNDGTVLVAGPPSSPSILYCPFDGWEYPRDWHLPIGVPAP